MSILSGKIEGYKEAYFKKNHLNQILMEEAKKNGLGKDSGQVLL